MEFCPKCGTRLIPNRQNDGKKASTTLICPKCQYSKVAEAPGTRGKTGSQKQEIVTVIGEEEAEIRTMPTVKMGCPKCGNQEAYWWMVQTRGSDESPTQFFRCTKCNHTWREMA